VSRQFRVVFGLQALLTFAAAAGGAWLAGLHGALSAILGGLVSMAAGLGFVLMVSKKNRILTAGEVLRVALRAEAVKFILVVLLLWAVLSVYKQVVIVGFIGTFCVTILVFGMAFFVRETSET
jgi:ATP synthase protein I